MSKLLSSNFVWSLTSNSLNFVVVICGTVCVCQWECLKVCVCDFECLCVFVAMCVSVCEGVSVCVWVWVCLWLCVCLWVYESYFNGWLACECVSECCLEAHKWTESLWVSFKVNCVWVSERERRQRGKERVIFKGQCEGDYASEIEKVLDRESECLRNVFSKKILKMFNCQWYEVLKVYLNLIYIRFYGLWSKS